MGPTAASRTKSESWWDASTSQWYDIGLYPLDGYKQGGGEGVLSSTPAGISCGSTCQAFFGAGTTVSLTATPADRWTCRLELAVERAR